MKAATLARLTVVVGGVIAGWAAWAQAQQDIGSGVPRPAAAVSEIAPPATPASPEAVPAGKPAVEAVDAKTAQILAEVKDLDRVRWERAMVAVRDLSRQARQSLLKKPLAADDFTVASKLIDQAKSVLNSNQEVAPTQAEFKTVDAELDSQLKYISDNQQSWNIQQVRDAANAQNAEARRAAEQAAQEKARQVESLFDQINSARMNDDMDAVITLANRILHIEPTNKPATYILRDAENQSVFNKQDKLDLQQDWERRGALNNVREAMIPYDKPMRYPEARVWEELTERRAAYAHSEPVDSPINQRVREKIQKITPVEVRFPGITFEDAIKFFQSLTQTNVNVNWQAIENAGYPKTTEVTMTLRDVSYETVLRELLSKAAGREAGTDPQSLDFVIRDGVIKISTKEDLDKNKYILVYDVRELVHPLTDFRVPEQDRDLGSGQGDDDDAGDGGLFGGANQQVDAGVGQEQAAEESRKEKVESFLNMIKQTIVTDSWTEGSVSEVDGLLVVKQTANGHRELAKLLQQLREHSRMQVCIEARFLTIESKFLEDIGLDLDFIFNLNRNNHWSPIPVSSQTFGQELVFNPATGGLAPPTGGTPPTIGNDIFSVARSSLVVAGSFMDDLQVDFFLRATQAHQQSTHLNALRVTLLNGHEAYIIVESQTDYVSDLTSNVASSATAFNPTTSQLVKGISFGVRATVTADRRYVLMTVYPTLRDDQLAGTFQFQSGNSGSSTTTTTTTTTTAGAAMSAMPRGVRAQPVPYRQGVAYQATDDVTVPGFSTGAQNAQIQLREAVIQEVRTTVMVPDMGTLLLGGQRIADELEVEQGVPILSKIPVLKRAFTSRSFVKRERTLLILIRPEILIPEELEQMVR